MAPPGQPIENVERKEHSATHGQSSAEVRKYAFSECRKSHRLPPPWVLRGELVPGTASSHSISQIRNATHRNHLRELGISLGDSEYLAKKTTTVEFRMMKAVRAAIRQELIHTLGRTEFRMPANAHRPKG